MPDFSAASAVVDGVSEIRVTGELDVYTSPVLRQRLREMIGHGSTRVVVNLSELTFIDSTGLGVLVGAFRRAEAMSVELVLEDVRPSAVKVFELTGLATMFRIDSTLVG